MTRTAHSLAHWIGTLGGATILVAAPAQARVTASLDSDRPAPFEREVFTLTLTVRAAGVRLSQEFDLQGWPSENVLQRISEFEELPVQWEQEGRDLYERKRFRCRVRLLQPGKVELSPVLRVGILTRIFTLWGPRTTETPHEVRVMPLTLTVRPLPQAGRPEPFSGAVGTFEFDAQVAPSEPAVGDLVRLTLRVRGTGALTDIVPPHLPSIPGFKVYDVQPRPPLGEQERVFEQVLIPLRAQVQQIPAITFTYFDPSADGGQYRSVTRGPFQLQVREPDVTPPEPAYRPFRPAEGTGTVLAAWSRPALRKIPGLSGALQPLAEEAVQAYTDGYAEGALRALRKIWEAGERGPEVELNLGHAWLARGNPGRAMLAYARARRSLPRDRDVRAALNRLLRSFGALPPPDSPLEKRLRWLTPQDWTLAAVFALIASAGTGLLGRWSRRRWSADPAVLMLLGLAVCSVWAGTRVRWIAAHEAVVMRSETAKFGPRLQSTGLFEVPEGSLVRVLVEHQGWVKIQAQDNRGWIPADSTAFPEDALALFEKSLATRIDALGPPPLAHPEADPQ